MPVDVLVLPSPLLPAGLYQPLVQALTDRGCVCRLASGAAAASPQQVIDRWAEQGSPSTRLIAHSNAGYLAPAVRAAAGAGHLIVFMDAALLPAEGDTALAPEALREQLASMVDVSTGTLPPWTGWWPKEEMLRTIPSDKYEAIHAACPRMPLSYFDSRIQAPERWAEGMNAYLAFGTTYSDEVAFARSFDWPTKTIDGSHLEFLWNVDVVADSVLELLAAEPA